MACQRIGTNGIRPYDQQRIRLADALGTNRGKQVFADGTQAGIERVTWPRHLLQVDEADKCPLRLNDHTLGSAFKVNRVAVGAIRSLVGDQCVGSLPIDKPLASLLQQLPCPLNLHSQLLKLGRALGRTATGIQLGAKLPLLLNQLFPVVFQLANMLFQVTQGESRVGQLVGLVLSAFRQHLVAPDVLVAIELLFLLGFQQLELTIGRVLGQIPSGDLCLLYAEHEQHNEHTHRTDQDCQKGKQGGTGRAAVFRSPASHAARCSLSVVPWSVAMPTRATRSWIAAERLVTAS